MRIPDYNVPIKVNDLSPKKRRLDKIREEYRNKKAWAITPAQAKYLYSSKYPHKSVKWDWFDKHAVPIERLKAPLRWNLQKLYEKIL